ncbi:MAG: HEAT repeat domain-containing protein [Deltaproteobacteria bacterium]|nr:HEAT repeat domain-containing protein [Deltaproteobacteria bacterium]
MDTSDHELTKVIGDFPEMGHVDNILAMFKQDPAHYLLTGELLRDERFMVRMGVAVLFEELKVIRPGEVQLAVPALAPLLADTTPWIRGEAVHLLGIIGGPEARALIEPMLTDPDPQVREIAADFYNQPGNGSSINHFPEPFVKG